MAVLRLVLLAALLGLCLAEKKRYDGYKVFRITPSDDFQVKSLFRLKPLLEDKTVDFWTNPLQIGNTVDLMVAPEDQEDVEELLTQQGMHLSVWISDVQKLIDESTPEEEEKNIAGLSGFNYETYHSTNTILQWVKDMASENSDIASSQKIGSSYQGRELRILKISRGGSNKPILWLMSGVHAREWLSPATQLKMVDMLVDGYRRGDSEIVNLVNNVDFYFLPMANPDGYEYSRTSDRLWRKTRSPAPGFCTGTDPNRNWDDHWNDPNSNTNPCSQTYRGSSAFSEKEVKAISNYILSVRSRVKVFIDMHCYSQMWLNPYGWTTTLPGNYNNQKSLADSAVAALRAVNGLRFTTGSVARVLYAAPGSSIDWAYSKAGIPYSYTPELRDKGNYGFVAPKSEIIKSANEVFAAFKVVAKKIA
ncbi:carboxypeptidase B-like isoform X2 [Acanthaster planci]|uniref:Carboxypeptidase B-like isoform X2 n=1 Tax=Acanthaster planci TaxID=133434 RepID=A0A8B7Z661_ACAPL|nr:carboxypeptidase B-like isoform X2 [Acanthaster planci]